MKTCPVCLQPLPKALEPEQLEARLTKLAAQGWITERQKLESEWRKKIPSLLEAERNKVRRQAVRDVRKDLLAEKQRADRAEREAAQVRRDLERKTEKQIATAMRTAAEQNEVRLEKLQASREKDRARYEADRAKLQGELDQLSRKLEKQSGEQLGTEAEVDLLAELRGAFKEKGDRIDPIGRGKKGADIIHDIMEDSKRIGRIVYESKNVSGWHNSWINHAKQYQSQYDTPNVMVVSRSFPRKNKGLCILKNIPVVEPRMAVCLASIIRDGICELADARTTGVGRNAKAQQLYDYILSPKFVTRFREIAESVELLRDNQQKEKDWHEDTWQAESEAYNKIDSRRREIDSQVKSIIKKNGKPAIVAMASRA
jgi:hypothetical protein